MVGQPPQQLSLKEYEVGWFLQTVGTFCRKRTICCPAGIRTPDCPNCGRVKIHSTVANRLLTLRFFIYHSDSQTLIHKTRYPPQIPAVATPHPTKFHIIYYSFPIYNNGKHGSAIRFFATRSVFGHELESENES